MTLSLIPKIHRATHAIALAVASDSKLGVNQAEAHILAHLHETREARISELHERFGHRRSTLTSVLDRLEQQGLIERRGDTADRRSFVVSLTKRGRSTAAAVHRSLAAIEATALDGFSDAERKRVSAALDAIASTTDRRHRVSSD